MKIYVAPGHGITPSGGFDPGAVSGHEVEHTLAHAVVAAYAAALRRNGITVVEETEPDPDYIGSVSRANAAGVDCGDEVHFNAGGGHGVEVEVHPATTAANRACAARMCQLVSGATGLPNRGPVDRTGLYWLNATVFPALLPEIAFVDADGAIIDQQGFAAKVGEALCQARCEYAGVAYRPAVTASLPGVWRYLIGVYRRGTDEILVGAGTDGTVFELPKTGGQTWGECKRIGPVFPGVWIGGFPFSVTPLDDGSLLFAGQGTDKALWAVRLAGGKFGAPYRYSGPVVTG